jgi:peptidyl-prolyl cis-trans isomerase SurA
MPRRFALGSKAAKRIFPPRARSTDLQPELRKILAAIPVGQLSAPEITKLGVELFAICNKRETKTDTAEKRHAREEIFNKRFEEQSKQYLRRLRREALIERK